ncbi:MAG TPA: hypothetical protein VF546_17735 [Pyrinomonadaceae bacterium]|jgi:hypothetical protein
MTDEERQRQMDFIINQQAQFAAGIQRLQEAHAEGEKRVARLERAVQRMQEGQAQIQEAQARSEKRLGRLERVAQLMVRAGLRLRREVRQHDALITTLIDSQIRTEEIARRNSEDIGRLVEVVGRLASHHNGDGSDARP